MAFVLLPCDLPTWGKIERMMQPLIDGCSNEQLVNTLHALHSLCNVSIDPDGLDSVPTNFFDPVKRFLSEEPNVRSILPRAMKQIAKSAIDLKNLKPPEGLSYSLQQQNDALILPRPIVASILAHTVLSTLPRRSVMSHPTLSNPMMAHVLHALDSEDERVKVRAVLQYFALLAKDHSKMEGRIIIERKVMSAETFIRLRRWRKSTTRLCRLQVTNERINRIPSSPCILACCCTSHPARAALVPHSIHDCRGLEDHPELLISGLIVEKFEDNEALQVSGVLSLSPPRAPSPDDLTFALIDADDYIENWILQYENINLLRELNKCFLAFSPPVTKTMKKIPSMPTGVPLKRHLTSGVSRGSISYSRDASFSLTPLVKSLDNADDNENQGMSDLDILDMLNRQSSKKSEEGGQKEGLSDLDILDMLNRQASAKSQESENSQCNKGLSDLDILDMLNKQSSLKSDSGEKKTQEGLIKKSSVKSQEGEKVLSDLDILDMLNKDDGKVKEKVVEPLSDLDILDMLNRESEKNEAKKEPMSDLDILDSLNKEAEDKKESPQQPMSDLDILDMLSKEAEQEENNKKEEMSDLDILDMLNKEAEEEKNKEEPMSDLDILDMINKEAEQESEKSKETMSDLDILDMLNKESEQDNEKKEKPASDLDILNSLNDEGREQNNNKNQETMSDLEILDMINQEDQKETSKEVLSDWDILNMMNKENENNEEECSKKQESQNRSKSKVSPEAEKRKIPKLLEKILPKKMLSPSKKKSEASDTKTEQSSGIGTGESEKGSLSSKASNQSRNKIVKNEEVTTIKKLTSKSDTIKEVTTIVKPRDSPGDKDEKVPANSKNSSQVAPKAPSAINNESLIPNTKQPNSSNRNVKGQQGDNTQDLLNRVLKAIQKLEAEESVLSKNSSQVDKDVVDPIQSISDLTPKSIGRLKSKPPLPESRRKTDLLSKRPAASKDGASSNSKGQHQDNLIKDSMYQSCGDDQSVVDDEQFFSACESLDMSEDLEEVYDHLEEVLHELEGATPGPRTAAIAQLAHSLLKRAFSESSEGVTVGMDGTLNEPAAAKPAKGRGVEAASENRPRSLSLTGGSLTNSGHGKDAASKEADDESKFPGQIPKTEGVTVLTDSWGCDELGGNHQLKAMIQWAASSMAGVENVVYDTHGHSELVKLAVVSRVLSDRQWTVGQLVEAILKHCYITVARWKALQKREPSKQPRREIAVKTSLFDRLLAPVESGADKE